MLKLFVWEDVLRDYTAGIMFALAHDAEEARRLIVAHTPHVNPEELKLEPQVFTAPVGFAVYGGG